MAWAWITEPADLAAAEPAGAAPGAHGDRLRAHQERQRRGAALGGPGGPVGFVGVVLGRGGWCPRHSALHPARAVADPAHAVRALGFAVERAVVHGQAHAAGAG